ncbi:probable methyltransferase TCM_000336 [Typha latifolia]|uniref:probable methyltransferase TCM_000336 n=1 Tax=Typha latifolia TaxID=4733 RepID=UPI003C2CBB2A
MTTSMLPSSNKHITMDMETILHMKKGLGETSYAQNSSLQKKSMDTLKHIIIDSAIDVYISQSPDCFTMADLGCASGPNALSLVGDIIKTIGGACRTSSYPTPEFLVFLNDLPTNDFNEIFVSLPEFVSKLKIGGKTEESSSPLVYLTGVPGSFYGRLFPRKSLHFVCSCSSLHWLSQVPLGLFDGKNKPINEGKMYISHSSPPTVAMAYFKQFQKDFSLFLKSRSAEVVSGGKMVLAMLGRQTEDYTDKRTTYLWELLAQSLAMMVSQGEVEQEKLDAYNVPFYAPSVKEIEDEVHKEGSFTIDYLRAYEIDIRSGNAKEDGRIISMTIRAIQESMICHHFGGEIIDTLFQNYTKLLTESVEKEEIKSVQIGLVLRRM